MVCVMVGLGGGVIARGQQGATSHAREEVAPAPTARFPAEWYPPASDAEDMAIVTGSEPPVLGAPFSATTVMTTQMSLGAGRAPVEGRIIDVTIRDTMGNTRTEESGAGERMRRIAVNDVVHHCSFEWTEPVSDAPGPTPADGDAAKVAMVRCSPLRLKRYVSDAPDPMEVKMMRATPDVIRDPLNTYQMQPLGERTMLGVRAVGQRQTRLKKDVAGQEQFEFTVDLWWSPELKEILSAKPVGDPTIVPAIEMKELRRGEPDAALFYPPAGWRIEHESRVSH